MTVAPMALHTRRPWRTWLAASPAVFLKLAEVGQMESMPPSTRMPSLAALSLIF